MSRTVSPSSGRPYGLARVCRVWRASRATTYRHLAPSRPEPPRRPGPVGPMPDAALVDAIRAVLTASPFHGEGHRKVWARLRVVGVRTSKRRVLRLRRSNCWRRSPNWTWTRIRWEPGKEKPAGAGLQGGGPCGGRRGPQSAQRARRKGVPGRAEFFEMLEVRDLALEITQRRSRGQASEYMIMSLSHTWHGSAAV